MAAFDPATVSSSSQIFSANYSLPQIRNIHKALHGEIEGKASRLRAQVGGSYRDLLGTADMIVQMRADNEAVQALLGRMGWQCGRDVVSAKSANLSRFMTGVTDEGWLGVDEAARRKLLDGCFLVVSRTLKGHSQLNSDTMVGDRLVLASKAWVLARLLAKSLEGEAARKTLDGLRRRLRGAVERMLVRVSDDADREDMLKALCAYGLATSSGASEVLRYMLEVRGQAMELALGAGEGAAEGVVQALRLYTGTLLDVQALVPGGLAQSLKALTETRLLDDASLKRLEVLRLDVCERWCGEEIQYFTPFIRHDDLAGTQAREALETWAERGREVLLSSLERTLDAMTDFTAVTDLRSSLLRLWIRESGKVRGWDAQKMQDGIRSAVNARMLAVLEAGMSRLDMVGAEVATTLGAWQLGSTGKVPGLWDEDGYDEALSRGAAPFIQEVASRLYGQSEAIARTVDCYRAWFDIVGVVGDVVEALKKQRWDNDYDEVEDEETIEARQQRLSRDDPKILQDAFDASVDASFARLEEAIRRNWEERVDDDKSGEMAMYLVRVLREIRRQLPKRDSVATFGLSVVPSMHDKMARWVSASPVANFTTDDLSARNVAGRPLWEGDPELPTQPSSEAFRFLHDLSTAMADAGVDLWTAAALKVLKTHVRGQLCEAWRRELEGVEDTMDVCIQWMFDISFLRSALGSGAEDEFGELDKTAFEKSGLEEPSRQRIAKTARGFWERSSLLFGVLD